MKWETVQYEMDSGREPVKDFLRSLDRKQERKVLWSIGILEDFGPSVGMPHVRYLREGIYELRTILGNNIFRILFFHWVSNKLVLTHGFVKKTQQTPPQEIDRAKKYRDDFLRRSGVIK